MADRLSGVAIIICIALGVLTFLLLFIFAKRQIMRFTLKSKHSPHVPIGHGVSKSLKDEVDRRLLIIKDIAYEPVLLKPNEKLRFADNLALAQIKPQHLLRMAVVDSLSILEEELGDQRVRKPGQDVRVFLLRQVHGGPLAHCDPRSIHRFLDLYEHARHGSKEFGQDQYLAFMAVLEELRASILTRGSPSKKAAVPSPPEQQTSPSVNFVSSTAVTSDPTPQGNTSEALASCRPTSLAFTDEDKARDAALETSV